MPNPPDRRPLAGQTVLITGGARRIGRHLALAAAHAGARVLIHHAHSESEATQTLADVQAAGGSGDILQADLADLQQAGLLIERAARLGSIDALVNNAAVFEPLTWDQTRLSDWQKHLDINLTAPFLLSQAFARALPEDRTGRIVNLLDWRALRPGADHFPYTISKSALAALTFSLAQALAPRITVNGLALGAILPPAGQGNTGLDAIIAPVPARRWGSPQDVAEGLLFLLTGPAYITGEIIHIDGGRHLV